MRPHGNWVTQMTQIIWHHFTLRFCGLAQWVFTPGSKFWVMGQWVNPVKFASLVVYHPSSKGDLTIVGLIKIK